ncbi:MAG: arginine--tRNA ligase, partial [Candidatus Paceibacterota bacterium]
MLKNLQLAVNAAAFAATQGAVEALPLALAPYGKGDIAICVSPLMKALGHPPQIAGKPITDGLAALPYVKSASLAGIYVNIRLDIDALVRAAMQATAEPDIKVEQPQRIMVEYLSPNTNKPLHLGHIRNGVLGSTLANLLIAVGHTVIRSELINDRGEHICKSMLGYMRHGNGATPESSGKKGDHLVGDMYVAYMNDDKARRAAIKEAATAEVGRWAAGNAEVHELLYTWHEGKKDKDKKEALKRLLKLTPSKEARSRQLLNEVDAPDAEVVDLLERWEAGDRVVHEL